VVVVAGLGAVQVGEEEEVETGLEVLHSLQIVSVFSLWF
jgi:hypothetical protein